MHWILRRDLVGIWICILLHCEIILLGFLEETYIWDLPDPSGYHYRTDRVRYYKPLPMAQCCGEKILLLLSYFASILKWQNLLKISRWCSLHLYQFYSTSSKILSIALICLAVYSIKKKIRERNFFFFFEKISTKLRKQHHNKDIDNPTTQKSPNNNNKGNTKHKKTNRHKHKRIQNKGIPDI